VVRHARPAHERTGPRAAFRHVWAYDFVAEKTHDGRRPKLLRVVDEDTRECLAVVVARRITSHEFHQLHTDDFDLADKLAAWEESYNVHRPHGGLGGLTP